MPTDLPYSGGVPGQAGSSVSDTYKNVPLLLGEVPPYGGVRTVPYPAGATFPLNSVVGLGADGNIAYAVSGGDTPITPIGITTAPLDNESAAGTVDVITSGHFNIDALAFDPSITTDAAKIALAPALSTLLFGVSAAARL